MKKGNLFEVARKQLKRKNIKITPIMVLDKAIEIRKKLDDKEEQRRKEINKKHYIKRIKTEKEK